VRCCCEGGAVFLVSVKWYVALFPNVPSGFLVKKFLLKFVSRMCLFLSSSNTVTGRRKLWAKKLELSKILSRMFSKR